MFVLALTKALKTRILIALVAVAVLIGWRLNSPEVREQIREVDASLMPGLRPIYSAKTEEKVIALTFDISWGNKMWPKVLAVLEQERLPSTFFLSGPWSRDHADAVKAIAAAGHQIESHGHRHDDFDRLSRQQVGENIQQAHAILEGLTGRKPSYIRPPNGAFNNMSVEAAKDLGYATVMWSVDSLDWKNPGVDAIIQRTTSLMHPGAVILMHASDSCKQTDQALPVIIRNLRQQGYKFVLLHDLIKTHGVDPNGYIRVRPTSRPAGMLPST